MSIIMDSDWFIKSKTKIIILWAIEQWNMVGARIKIMWEEQIVDLLNEY